jgi:hypothetical protein
MPNQPVSRVMVAVHGVGDQLANETVRSVAAQVCRYYSREGTLALGSFPGAEPASFIIDLPEGVPPDIGFAEVYWAGIARRVATGGYVLEDARMWAKTIVARVQASATGTGMSPKDCLLVENVLEELIDTVKVVDRLCFIASKAGLFTVNLQRVLDHFVNDVQLVADFQPYRDEILGTFHKLMGTVHRLCPDAKIYIVAHSEGTVVALAGLLSAIGDPDGVALSGDDTKDAVLQRHWLDHVGGVMTIGAPLDTHMLLWRPLWKPLIPPKVGRWTTATPIPWHNYYDRGDPIADSLTTTKGWLADNCPGAFNVKVDHGFSRFVFPGKAHVDYWHDDHVFGHFIQDVTGLPAELPVKTGAVPPGGPAAAPAPAAPSTRPDYSVPPPSKRWPQFVSYFAPYGLIALLSYTAVFILYKVVTDYLQNKPGSAIWRDVLTLAFLLVGMTIAVRIPRLSAMWRWRLFGLVLFALAVAAYAVPIVWGPDWLRGMQMMIGKRISDLRIMTVGVPVALGPWVLPIGTIAVALICWAFGRSGHNRVGMRILLIAGGFLTLLIVVSLVVTVKDRPIWPVVLASAAFMYLWWLTALLFDLVFVWHRYIRHSAAVADLRELQAPKAAAAGAKTA